MAVTEFSNCSRFKQSHMLSDTLKKWKWRMLEILSVTTSTIANEWPYHLSSCIPFEMQTLMQLK